MDKRHGTCLLVLHGVYRLVWFLTGYYSPPQNLLMGLLTLEQEPET